MAGRCLLCCRLRNKNGGWVIGIEQCQLILEGLLGHNVGEVEVRIIIINIIPQLLKTKSDAPQEFGAAAIHEPDLEHRITRQRSRRQGLTRTSKVVRAEDRLLKFLLENKNQG